VASARFHDIVNIHEVPGRPRAAASVAFSFHSRWRWTQDNRERLSSISAASTLHGFRHYWHEFEDNSTRNSQRPDTRISNSSRWFLLIGRRVTPTFT